MRFVVPLKRSDAGRLYFELAKLGAFSVGENYPWGYEEISREELFTLAILQARYDPSLMVILVDFFMSVDSRINPVLFKELLRENDALQVAMVIGEFVLGTNVSESTRDFFDFMRVGVRPVPIQLFYKGLYNIGGKKMDRIIVRPLLPFKKWGFLAGDPPILKEKKDLVRTSFFDAGSRIRILKNLAKNNVRFRLKDYLEEINFSVSRQQALKDIGSVPWIIKRGKGRGSDYHNL